MFLCSPSFTDRSLSLIRPSGAAAITAKIASARESDCIFTFLREVCILSLVHEASRKSLIGKYPGSQVHYIFLELLTQTTTHLDLRHK